MDWSKSQSRNFVAAGESTLFKALTRSSVHSVKSATSRTSQLPQNDLKQVNKDITDGFDSKYTEPPYDNI